MMKICNQEDCDFAGQEQKISNFYVRSNNKKLYRNQCKLCDKKGVIRHFSTKKGFIRCMYNSAKARSVTYQREIDISVKYVTYIWEKQKGCCAISGREMTHIIGNKKDTKTSPFNASIDRIDSKKGYTKDNIHLICNWLQTTKMDHNLDDVKKWIIETSNYIQSNPISDNIDNSFEESTEEESVGEESTEVLIIFASSEEVVKKGNKCVDCDIKITRRAKRCEKCFHFQNRKVVRPSRNVLLKDIKELGYAGTGRKYSVTDNTIRKWIK